MILQMLFYLFAAVSFTDVCLRDDQMYGFSNVVTNGSTGALVGGSCTGGMVFLCVLIYFLYRLLRTVPNTTPVVILVRSAEAFTNQSGACGNAPSSSPPAYDEVFPMEECIC